MKKLSKNNFPQREVIAYDANGNCMQGFLTPTGQGLPRCKDSLGRRVLTGIVAYETLSEAKKRVQAVLTVKTK